jgi:membrane protein implicated in regulation of membrane protease activity
MIKQQSARSLLWFLVILLVVGAAITDPAAGFAFMALAGLGALGIITLGDMRLKLIGLLALAVSVGMAVAYWPAAKNHLAKYQERAKNAASKNSTPIDVPEKR